MIIIAIRHTSVDVPSGICYGITNVPLAGTFSNEADQISQQLGNQLFDIVFSSPLSRCTTLVARIFPEIKIVVDYRLKELNFGDWEMQSWNSIFNSSEGKAWFQDYAHASCPNGESFVELVARIKSFLDELKPFENEQIVIITHAGVIRALMVLLQQKSAEEAFNTSLKYGEVIYFAHGTDPKLATRNP